MRVIAIGASWCNKCKEAKAFLNGYRFIEWLDYNRNIFAKSIMDQYEQEHLPFFIVMEMEPSGSVKTTPFASYRKLGKHLEEISN